MNKMVHSFPHSFSMYLSTHSVPGCGLSAELWDLKRPSTQLGLSGSVKPQDVRRREVMVFPANSENTYNWVHPPLFYCCCCLRAALQERSSSPSGYASPLHVAATTVFLKHNFGSMLLAMACKAPHELVMLRPQEFTHECCTSPLSSFPCASAHAGPSA